jgi:hypothetical protein
MRTLLVLLLAVGSNVDSRLNLGLNFCLPHSCARHWVFRESQWLRVYRCDSP